MKVLFLSNEYPPYPSGGLGSYTASMARALSGRGHEVHVLSCNDGQEHADHRDGDVVVHRRDFESAPRRLRGDARPVARRLATAAACRSEAAALGASFDVVESPDYLAQGLAMVRDRVPVAAYAHTPRWAQPGSWLAERVERELLRRAVLVRCPSQILADHLVARQWVAPSRLHVMDPPIELDDWVPTEIPDGPPVVLLAGRFEAVKAPEMAVLAAVALRRHVPDLTLRFVGKPLGRRDGVPYGEWLWSLAATLGVRHEFVPDQPRSALAEHYAAARVVVVPSAGDNLPMVGLEAMACGRPVVSTDRCGLAEVIPGTGAGSIVPAGDPTALAEAMLPYLTDREHAAAAGRKARALVEDRYDPARVAADVESLYSSVAAGC